MDAIEAIKGRRSIRKYKDQKVDRELMTEVVDSARWAPSWGNFQVARWTLVDDPDLINRLASEGVDGFVYNISTLRNAKGVAVLSFVKGKSGKLEEGTAYSAGEEKAWEVFDAGLACQSFLLAAYAKGIGTCVMGVINDESIAKIVNLPPEETVAALIVYGYPEGKVNPPPRKKVQNIMRFAE